MGENDVSVKEWLKYNAYLGKNLDRIARTLERINWNLGVIANPEIKEKYKKDSDNELSQLMAEAEKQEQ